MELLADVITQTLGPEVAEYLTLAEMRTLGIYVGARKLREIADSYPGNLHIFEELAYTPDGRSIIREKLLLGEVPMTISTNTNFYLNLNLSRKILKRYVKTCLNLIPHALEIFVELMYENDIIRELILPTVIKYGADRRMLYGREYKKLGSIGKRIEGLALRSDTPKALERLIRLGLNAYPSMLDMRSHFQGWKPRRTPAVVDFIVDELLSDPNFAQYRYTEPLRTLTQNYFNQVLFRPNISMETKTKIVKFMQQHPIV